MINSWRAGRVVVGVLLGLSTLGRAQSPNEGKTWYAAALDRLSLTEGNLQPSGKIPLSDADLASMIYDTYQDPGMADQLEAMAKREIDPPRSLPDKSPQRVICSFAELGHLQIAYAKPFAVMSAQTSDDLFKTAKSPTGEAAWAERSISRLWIRLGEKDKALAMLDPTSSLYIEELCELIRVAHAAAQVDVARSLATQTLDVVLKTNPEVDDIVARHLSLLVEAQLDCEEIDAARAALAKMPASGDALPAYKALFNYDRAHGEDEALDKDLAAMLAMLEKIGEFDSAQTSACIAAAEICVKLKRDAEAVKCFDRLDQLANQPDPPLTMPLEWANAARISLYTTANDRADGYLARAKASMKADKDAKDGDRLLLDLMDTRIMGIRSQGDAFEASMKALEPRIKASDSFLVPYAGKEMMVELAGVTRDEKILASLKQIAPKRGMGEVGLAMVKRYSRTGEPDAAWTLAQSLPDPQWRVRAMIHAIHSQMEIADEATQKAALLDAQTISDPRESAYVLFAVGAMIEGDIGYRGDAWMRGE